MATSPLSLFRKYQYIFLVVFGVMLMVAFIVAPPLDDYLRTQGTAATVSNEVVVTWKGGQLRESDFEKLRLMHRLAVSYLFAVVQETRQRDGTPRGVRTDQFGQVVDPGIPSSMSDENLLHTHLLAQEGEEMGLVVSDDAVMEFLVQLSDEQIAPRELGKIFQDRFGTRFTEKQLIQQLRVELTALRVRSLAEAGLLVPPYGTVPPAQAWNYFRRLHRNVRLELAAYPVEQFESKVQEKPTDEQLKPLYEQGKDRYPYPDLAEPGFKRRRQAVFQYVRADFNKFLEEEKAKVLDEISDEEIEAYYEENKDQRYKKLALPGVGAANPGAADTGSPAGEAAREPAGEAAEAESDSKPVEDDKAPAASDAATPPADTPPADTPPADTPPADTPPADTPAPAADKPAAKEGNAPAEPEAGSKSDQEPASDSDPKQEESAAKEESPAAKEESPAENQADPAATQDATTPNSPPAEPQPSADDSSRSAVSRQFFVSTQVEAANGSQEAEGAASETAAGETPSAQDPGEAGSSPQEPAEKDTAQPDQPAETPPAETPSAETGQPAKADDGTVTKADGDQPAAAKAGTEQASPEGEPPSEKEAPAEEAAPAKEEAPTKKDAAAEGSDAGSTGDEAAAGTQAEDTPPAEPEYRPLDDELRAEIREELAEIQARQPAQERLDTAFAEVRKRVNRQAFEYRKQTYNEEGEEIERAEVSGPPVELEDVVAEPGLEQGKTPLVDSLSVRELDLGQAFNMQFDSWPPTRQFFYEVAFNEGVRLYDPAEIRGGEADIQFLYWKIEDHEPFIPSFDEAWDDVVAAWRRIKARSLAKEAAKQIADDAADSGKTLAEFLADDDAEVTETGQFSWMTTGLSPAGAGPPAMSSVDGVDGAGEAFMESVFKREPGEFGVAANAAESVVYVFRVVSESPSDEQLRQRFLASGNSPEVQYIAYVESADLLRDWYESFDEEHGVTWKRPPEQSG